LPRRFRQLRFVDHLLSLAQRGQCALRILLTQPDGFRLTLQNLAVELAKHDLLRFVGGVDERFALRGSGRLRFRLRRWLISRRCQRRERYWWSDSRRLWFGQIARIGNDGRATASRQASTTGQCQIVRWRRDKFGPNRTIANELLRSAGQHQRAFDGA